MREIYNEIRLFELSVSAIGDMLYTENMCVS